MTSPREHPLPFKSVTYTSPVPGTALMVTGAVHGNETCGTRGIQRVMGELDSGALAIVRGAHHLRAGDQSPRLRQGRALPAIAT
jgi:hypothetical protein